MSRPRSTPAGGVGDEARPRNPRLFRVPLQADLERHREAPREAPHPAGNARERLAFLAEASSILAGSLDYATTLENVANLAVPALADWCFVDLHDRDGGFHRVAIAHEDPEMGELAEDFRRGYTPLPDAPHGISRVILSGTPEIMTSMPDWVLVSVARDAQHLELLRAIGIRSSMCVPLIARGKTIGAISFLSTHPLRIYGLEDLAFAEEIARRAALAVDNARLYQEAVTAQEQLRHQLDFTSALAQSMLEGVCAFDAEGRFTFVNPAAEAILGRKAGEFMGKDLHGTLHPSCVRGKDECPLAAAVRGERVVQEDDDVFTRADGTTFYATYTASPLATHRRGAVLVFHDVTQRKRTQMELRFQARLLRAVGESVIATDTRGRITYWNHASETLFGWLASEVLGRGLAGLLTPPGTRGADAGWRAISHSTAHGREWSGEMFVQHRDGRTFPLATTVVPVREADGRIVGAIAVSEDVTERKRAEQALLESERKYRHIVETAHEGVWVLDAQGRTTYANRRMGEILGIPSTTLMGKSMEEFLHDEGQALLRNLLARTDRSPQLSHDFRFLRKDGGETWAILSTNPIRDEDGNPMGALVMVTDITQRKRAEEELEASRRQMAISEKLSALGTLVSGVAHEIRTPLTYLSNNLFLATSRLEAAVRQRPELHDVLVDVNRFARAAMDGIDRINALVKDLRPFVSAESGRRVETTLPDVVGVAADLFRATQRGRVVLETDLQPTPPLLLDKGQVQRVVINLLMNAAEAMPRGGRVWVRTAHAPGGAVVEVEDEGVGLSTEVEGRMFDPFFTTKPEGTGLGLSISRQIVEAHGGRIHHAPRHGGGTRFTIFLPTARSAPHAPPGDHPGAREDPPR